MQPRHGLEEQAVERHRVVDARAGQDHAVQATEGRDHDGRRHHLNADRAENDRGGSRAHAILGSVLNGVERQDAQVDHVGGDVQSEHDRHAQRQRERNVAPRIASLAGREGHVVPSFGGEQGAHHRDSHQANGGEAPIRVAPEVAEVFRDCLGMAAEQEANEHQPEKRADLREREHVLYAGSGAHATRVHPAQQDEDRDGHQLLRAHAEPADAGQAVVSGDPGEEHARELRERHRYRRERAGLDHQEQRPAVEESAERAEGLAQVDVLAARLWHRGRQFAIAERRDHGDHRSDHPGHEHQSRRTYLARDIGRDNEDAGADHRSDHQCGRVDEPKAFQQAGASGLFTSGRHRAVVRRISWIAPGARPHNHQVLQVPDVAGKHFQDIEVSGPLRVKILVGMEGGSVVVAILRG